MNFRYAALFLLGAAACAQPPAEPKPATVEGTVLNSVTKVPLRKVDLSLANGEMSPELAAMMAQIKPGGSAPQLPSVATRTMTATTDAMGKFHFENVPPGTYWLTAKKAGYGDGKYPEKGGDGSVRLSSGQELKTVDLHLVPHATLSGRVLDEDGEPYPSANVSALTYSFAHGRRRMAPVDMAQTNNKGEFSLTKVPPGHYFLCADVMRLGMGTAAAPAPADGSPETAYVGTYLPNTIDAAMAQKLDVAAGAELSGFNIRLQKSKVVRVTGKLTDANGEPIKTAQIMLMAGGGRIGSMSMTMVANPEGKFELTNLQPGTYSAITVQMQGSSPKMSMQTLVVPDHSVENAVLGARREAVIQGKVVLDGDAKVALEGFPISLTPSEGLAVMPASAKADKSGVFTLEGVTPAAYDLTLPLSPAGTYVKSVTFNDRESLGRALDCSAITAGTLGIVLGTDGGKVTGRVSRDDKPAPNATVVLLPADPSRRFPATVRQGVSDEAGHIALNDVPPGDYLAFAWEEVEDGAWFDADFVKTAQGQAVKVQVGPKASEEIELKLLPASK
jgi:uncharacterized protein (DUF2141 family)